MSRSGKKPIAIPKGTEVMVRDGIVKVKGPKGQLQCELSPEIEAVVGADEVRLSCEGSSKMSNVHGLARALVHNMVQGVNSGFEKRLEIRGVGYRAAVSGRVLEVWVGFTYPKEEGSKLTPPTRVAIPADLEVRVSNGTFKEKEREEKMMVVHVSGVDPQRVGQFAADVRKLRPPEPYKGKGIRYEGEFVLRKEGKKAAK